MQILTYLFIAVIVLVAVGLALNYFLSKRGGGEKLVTAGLTALQAGKFSDAYNQFTAALPATFGTDGFFTAVKGLSKAYEMAGAHARLEPIMKLGADCKAIKKDPRYFHNGFTAEGQRVFDELKSRLRSEIKALPSL